jgi:small subunit ribosomal protein S4
VKLFLKGQRCFSTKCGIERRNYPPGEHGQMRRKLSNYAVQLREKQKLRRIYGLNERQFKNYFDKAERMPGISGENFLKILETRLDNVVFRMGLTTSRNAARQFVRHGHVIVNGRKVNVPSYIVRVGEVITVKEKIKTNTFLTESIDQGKGRATPPWLELNLEKFEAKIVAIPTRGEIDVQINEQLIVEFYSK